MRPLAIWKKVHPNYKVKWLLILLNNPADQEEAVHVRYRGARLCHLSAYQEQQGLNLQARPSHACLGYIPAPGPQPVLLGTVTAVKKENNKIKELSR